MLSKEQIDKIRARYYSERKQMANIDIPALLDHIDALDAKLHDQLVVIGTVANERDALEKRNAELLAACKKMIASCYPTVEATFVQLSTDNLEDFETAVAKAEGGSDEG